MPGLESITSVAELTGVLLAVGSSGIILSFTAVGFPLCYAAGKQNERGIKNIMGIKDGKSGLRFWRDCLTKVGLRDIYRLFKHGNCKEFSQKHDFLNQYLIISK